MKDIVTFFSNETAIINGAIIFSEFRVVFVRI